MELVGFLTIAALLVGTVLLLWKRSGGLSRRDEPRQIEADAPRSAETSEILGERDPEDAPVITVTDEVIERRMNSDRVERVRWDEIDEVSVRTTSDGPWNEDVFFLIGDIHGRGVAVPSDAVGELLPRLQELQGFDNEAFIEAMGSAGDQTFVLWRRGN